MSDDETRQAWVSYHDDCVHLNLPHQHGVLTLRFPVTAALAMADALREGALAAYEGKSGVPLQVSKLPVEREVEDREVH